MAKKAPGKLQKILVEWLGGSFTTSDVLLNDWLKYWNGSSSSAGQTVNETNVLSLSAAWACNRLISESVGSLPLFLYERTPTGRRKAENHPLYYALHDSPNPDSTSGALWEAMTSSMVLRGNGFSEILRAGQRVVGLQFLSPGRLQMSRQHNGTFKWLYLKADGTHREIPANNIFHIPGFTTDGKWGMSAIQYGAAMFGGSLAAQNAANNHFEKGLMPTVAFTIDRVIDADQRDDFRTYVENISGALNAGKSPLLEQSMDAKSIGIPPKDAQLLETRTFMVEEVCRWFRVDPSLVGHGGKDSNFGTGLEQKMLGFLMFTLRVWLRRIEQHINMNLLTAQERRKYYAEFNIEGILRADSKSRAEFYQIMVLNGILTRDEVRKFENLQPMGGNADVLTVNSATAELDQLLGGNQAEPNNMTAALDKYIKAQRSEK